MVKHSTNKLIGGRRLLSALAICAAAFAACAQISVSTITGLGTLTDPSSVTVNLTNNFYYVSDTPNHRIVRFDPSTGTRATFGEDVLANPQGLVATRGGVLVSDGGHTIWLITETGAPTLIAGALDVAGNSNGVGTAARFNAPGGMAVDAAGNVYIADTLNNSIRRLAPDNTVTTYATGFLRPSAVTVDEAGRVYVADTSNHEIKMIETNGVVTAIAGVHRISGAKNSGIGTLAELNTPSGVLWIGGKTGLIVSDTGNGVIRSVTPNSSRTVWSVDLFSTDVATPVGMSLDNVGAILVVDGIPGRQLKKLVRPAQRIPNFSLPPPTFNNAATFFYTSEPGAILRYTVNGTEPTLFSSVITNDIVFDGGPSFPLMLRYFSPDGVAGPTQSNIVMNFTVANPTITSSVPAVGGVVDADNSVSVVLTNITLGSEMYYTFGTGSPTNGTRYTNGTPIIVSQSSQLRVQGVRNLYFPSAIITQDFHFKVSAPVAQPPGGNYTNNLVMSIASATTNAIIYYTLDGSVPTQTNLVITNLNLASYATNSTITLRAFRTGFDPSDVVSNTYVFSALKPVISPDRSPVGGVYFGAVTNTFITPTTNAVFYYTLDGSDPATNVTGRLTNSFAVVASNSILTVIAARPGFATSPSSSLSISIKVPTPVMSPNSGYFPQGANVTLTVTGQPGAQIYYRLDGGVPTTNDFLYTGPIRVDQTVTPGQDLRVISARAFYDNTTPSDVVTGQAIPSNSIGVPQGTLAGVGSTVVVPLVLNLQSNITLRSLQFRVHVARTSVTTPNIATDVRSLAIGSNDFLQLVAPAASGSATLTTSAFNITNGLGTITNVLLVSAIGTNANVSVNNFATLTLLAVTIPETALPGQTYSIDVVQASGTTNGSQGPITLTSMTNALVTVSNIAYIVGDVSPGHWYNAGDFGNGDLDNSDVNTVFYASLGVRLPYTFTDVFDAMDTFPDDTAGGVGGDGQIRFLDWQRVLQRSLRQSTSNWQRAWGQGAFGGFRTNAVRVLPNTPAEIYPMGVMASVLQPQARIRAGVLGNARASTTAQVPVYVNVNSGASIAGLQFRAVVVPQGNAPALSQPVEFVAASGLPEPIRADALTPGEIGASWSLVLNPFSTPLQGDKLLGYVKFELPTTAQLADAYTVQFRIADGSPDLDTAYEMGTQSGSVSVGVDAQATPNPLPGFRLKWYATQGARFLIESTTDLNGGVWQTEAPEIYGRGKMQEFVDQNTTSNAKFYRVRTLN